MEFQQENQNAPVSKYNSAVAQLYRLDNLWQMANYHRISGNLVKWNLALDAVYGELSGDTSPQQDKNLAKINKRVAKFMHDPTILNQLLAFKHKHIKHVENEQGKGTAYRESDEDYMNN
jgi:hypothetical protein